MSIHHFAVTPPDEFRELEEAHDARELRRLPEPELLVRGSPAAARVLCTVVCSTAWSRSAQKVRV